jgi:hypothetical protein
LDSSRNFSEYLGNDITLSKLQSAIVVTQPELCYHCFDLTD